MNLAFNVMNLVLKSDEFGFKMMNFAALHGLRRDGGPLPRAGKRLLIYQAPACSTDLTGRPKRKLLQHVTTGRTSITTALDKGTSGYDEFCTKSDQLYINYGDFCINDDEFCIKNDKERDEMIKQV